MAIAKPSLIAFDFFGTLVRNEVDSWITTLTGIVEEQKLDILGSLLHTEWSRREVNFRRSRTNMASPADSPPFRSYWEAWRDAFNDTFDALGLEGDANRAATRCVDDLCFRVAFDDADIALMKLTGKVQLAIMSNADNKFLHNAIAFNSWSFDCVVSSESARAYKPDPRAFHALCEQTGFVPSDILYVGDSTYDDVHGAKLVGMRTVLVQRDQHTPGRTPPPNTIALHPPDYEIVSLNELPDLLETLE